VRFVILEHDHPILHWDLMLEAGDALHTWRLAEEPVQERAIEATALADHRAMYLDYEGPVSGNRGTVRRWDAGEFAEDAESSPSKRVLFLQGVRVQGRVRIERMDGTSCQFLWQGQG
jgi:hypothetical protein